MTNAAHSFSARGAPSPVESPVYRELESHDPEGHGIDIGNSRAMFVAVPLIGAALVAAALIVMWIVNGMPHAVAMLLMFFGLALLGAMPVWGASILREREHVKLIHEAERRERAAARGPIHEELNQVWSELEDIRAVQTEDAEGGHGPEGVGRRQDELLRRARELTERLAE
ncbi:MAG: hypothetical protein ACF8LK_09805 [Phycisphaerales bacterium JB041]